MEIRHMTDDRTSQADAPFLSIIIPAHNEVPRLPGTMAKVSAFLAVQPYRSEVLIVENGSRDDTWGMAQQLARQYPNVRAFRESQRGKGLAVRRGMLEARGEYRFLCDADLSMPIEEVARFLPPALTDCDVAIGTHELPDSIVYNEPPRRRRMGRCFNLLVRLTVLPGLRDTQCGFKCFRASAAEKVFSRQSIGGMAFDVEALFIARRLGMRIVEVAIPWHYDPGSRVRALRDSMQMAKDVIGIRLRAAAGRYRS